MLFSTTCSTGSSAAHPIDEQVRIDATDVAIIQNKVEHLLSTTAVGKTDKDKSNTNPILELLKDVPAVNASGKIEIQLLCAVISRLDSRIA